MNNTYPYPYSAAEARERNELSLWRESHKANIACRNAIEEAIRQNFDGMHLDKNCIDAPDDYDFGRNTVTTGPRRLKQLNPFPVSSLCCGPLAAP